MSQATYVYTKANHATADKRTQMLRRGGEAGVGMTSAG